ncbi:MAG: epoxyqueuosine reductase QueH [bacterium]
MEKLLLHTCCGPCFITSLLYFKDRYEIIPFWFNPNIHPYQEFKRRLFAFRDSTEGFDTIVDETYNLIEYFNAVEWGKRRCSGCYKLRLSKTAEVAVEQDIQIFSSTLLTSPYQDISQIIEIGNDEARVNCVSFLSVDITRYYKEGHNKAREMGLYLQSYCGCIFSEEERFSRKDDGRR